MTLRRILLFLAFPLLLLLLAHLTAMPDVPLVTAVQEKAVGLPERMWTTFTLLGAKMGEPQSALKLAEKLAAAGDAAGASQWRNFAEVTVQNAERRAILSLYVAIIAVILSAWTALRTATAPAAPVSPEFASLAAMFIFLLSRKGPYSGEMVPLVDTICLLFSFGYLASAFVTNFKMWRGAKKNDANLFEAAAGVLMAVPWICRFLFWDNAFMEQLSTTLAGGAAISFPWAAMYWLKKQRAG